MPQFVRHGMAQDHGCRGSIAPGELLNPIVEDAGSGACSFLCLGGDAQGLAIELRDCGRACGYESQVKKRSRCRLITVRDLMFSLRGKRAIKPTCLDSGSVKNAGGNLLAKTLRLDRDLGIVEDAHGESRRRSSTSR